jgi:hypothetical protein
MSNNYPPGGALFPNGKKTASRQPDYRGNIEFDRELLQIIQEQLVDGVSKVKLDLAGWRRQGRNGEFISLKASKPWVRDGAAPSQNVGRHTGGYAGAAVGGYAGAQTQGSGFPSHQQASPNDDDEIPF